MTFIKYKNAVNEQCEQYFFSCISARIKKWRNEKGACGFGCNKWWMLVHIFRLITVRGSMKRDNRKSDYSSIQVILFLETITASKISLFGVIKVSISPHSDWIRRDMEYTDTFLGSVLLIFHAMSSFMISSICVTILIYLCFTRVTNALTV